MDKSRARLDTRPRGREESSGCIDSVLVLSPLCAETEMRFTNDGEGPVRAAIAICPFTTPSNVHLPTTGDMSDVAINSANVLSPTMPNWTFTTLMVMVIWYCGSDQARLVMLELLGR